MGNSALIKNNVVTLSPKTSPSLVTAIAAPDKATDLTSYLKTGDMHQLTVLLEHINEVSELDKKDCDSLAASFQRIFLKETESSRMFHSSQREFAQAMEKSDPRSLVLLLQFAQLQQRLHIAEQEEKQKQLEKDRKMIKSEEANKRYALKSEGKVKPAECTINTETKVTNAISDESDEEVTSRILLATTVEAIDKVECDRLFTAGSWLADLLVAVQGLPVCVSIASASPSRPGFPLIYVNGCFEATTGYTKAEIVGQNCRFLQAGKAELESIQRMSIALRDAKPVKVSITNYRKDGMPFRNLLAMKPIFDENGVYRYVVGIQFDVTAEDATPQRLKMTDELMHMLPDVIPKQNIDAELYS